MPRRHFHSFDALRFLAFAKVFLLHLPVTAFPAFNFLRAGGGTGVSFFFVLSGFLITYILLEEKQWRAGVDLKKFYFRRALRIWPLYYAMVAFALLTPLLLQAFRLPSSPEGYTPRWFMSVFFLENYEMIRTGTHPNVSPLGVTWSLCVEEHFYLIWGLLLAWIPFRRLPLAAMLLIVMAFLARSLFIARGWPAIDLLTNMDYFMYGAIPAWLYVQQGEKLEARVEAMAPVWKYGLLALVIGYVLISGNISYPGQRELEPLLFGIGFASLLVLLLPAKTRFRISDRNPLTWLGRYTYGLYLLHTVVINLLLVIFTRLGRGIDQPLAAFAFVLSCFALTLAFALFSYRFLELPFMRLKERFRSRSGGGEPVSGLATPAPREEAGG